MTIDDDDLNIIELIFDLIFCSKRSLAENDAFVWPILFFKTNIYSGKVEVYDYHE